MHDINKAYRPESWELLPIYHICRVT